MPGAPCSPPCCLGILCTHKVCWASASWQWTVDTRVPGSAGECCFCASIWAASGLGPRFSYCCALSVAQQRHRALTWGVGTSQVRSPQALCLRANMCAWVRCVSVGRPGWGGCICTWPQHPLTCTQDLAPALLPRPCMAFFCSFVFLFCFVF